MHLSVGAGQRTVPFEHHRRIVVQTRRPALEQRTNQHQPVLCRQLRVKRGRGTGNAFGQVKQVGGFLLAEIQSIMQFLQNHQFRTLSPAIGDFLRQHRFVLFRIGRNGGLNQGNLDVLLHRAKKLRRFSVFTPQLIAVH